MYHSQFLMLFEVLERAALMLTALFLLTQAKLFKNIMNKQASERKTFEVALISLLFIFFAIFSTYTGVEVEGSLINVRIIAIVSGGILFGPWVGLPAGILSGIHRYLIDIDGPTSIPCLITSILAGVLSTVVHKHTEKKDYMCYGIGAGIFCECLTMFLIVMLAKEKELALSIVSNIALPMILGSTCIGLIIKRVQDIDDEKEQAAAQQAKIALDIANQTLPYVHKNDPQSLQKLCEIICKETAADAVSMTNTQDVLAYTGIGVEDYLNNESYLVTDKRISELTQRSIAKRQQTVHNKLQTGRFQSVLIMPLFEGTDVTGTLKIFYTQENKIGQALQEMSKGLSQLISTQLVASRVQQANVMVQKAEFSALQHKINPHFLFNALNAISTLIRIQPDKARSLIANLADFLRYNLERDDDLIDVQHELQQVRDYVAIEQARFGDKLTVSFDIDAVHTKIPCLLIQPLVENAIQHGIQPSRENGEVIISVKQHAEFIRVSVLDTGSGINSDLIDKLKTNKMEKHKIGLINVHQRVYLLYGHGLNIERITLENGRVYTQVSFDITLS
ncbi:histidine kinase [Vibrio sp. S11_S32]|uniref:LytS/YhcK type 5TM receptor domain-containing protein n=1 Tax=Vibrio sp. S11_S32 TaxID=2720225 RepID=UPI001DA38084|nr:histidine kinase [Vibrio sp. S11_S32]